MPRSLKVYRTPIGFHDAYIAVPTKKAAIEAWGAGSDIFQRGEAEEVTDTQLTTEPLASPGVVIKRLRGSSADHLAALSTAPSAVAGGDAAKSGARVKSLKPAQRPKPRPSRTAVEETEAAISAARKANEAEVAKLIKREEALAGERREIEKKQQDDLARLEKQLENAEASYQAAIQKWRGRTSWG